MSYKPRNQNNIIKFPGVNSKAVEDQDKNTDSTVLEISKKMTESTWDIQPMHDLELSVLAQFGECLEFKPIVARRLIANLSTELKKERLINLNPYGDIL